MADAIIEVRGTKVIVPLDEDGTLRVTIEAHATEETTVTITLPPRTPPSKIDGEELPR